MKTITRLLSLVLAVITVGTGLVAFPTTVSAVEDLNKDTSFVELDGPRWDIDLTSTTTNPSKAGSDYAVDCGDYTVHRGSVNFKQYANPTDSTATVWGVQSACSSFLITDQEMNLTSYKEFTVSLDMYFEAFPQGTRSDNGQTQDECPLSLVKWRATKSGETSQSDIAGIRVNGSGELCTATSATSGTGVFLPAGEWFNLSMTFVPEQGFFTVSLNGKKVLQVTFTSLSGASGSVLYLWDGYFAYTAYMKDIKVSTSNRIHWSISTNPSVSWQKNGTGTKYPTAIINSSSAWVDVEPEQKNGYSLFASTINLKQYTDPANSKCKVWGFQENKGTFFICDDDNLLVDSAAFTIATDMYFDEFPSGTYSTTDNRSPDDYPVSLLKWRVVTTTGGGYHHNSIRINSEGELCTNANSTSGTGVFLPKDEWFHIAMTVCPSSGRYEIYINGVREFIGAFPVFTKTVESVVGFFDGYFNYTAYVKNPSITTLDETSIGVTAESSADYFDYQTKDNGDGTFDVRFLSTIDPAAFAATGEGTSGTFAEAGYEVTAVWVDANGETRSNVQRLTTESVYSRISSGEGFYSHPDGQYIHALAVRGIDTSIERIEFTVRPYTELRGGGRRYGHSVTLLWSGKTDVNGAPVLSTIEQLSPYKTNPTDDTFVRLSSKTTDSERGVNGNSTYLYLKYVAPNNTYNRQAYLKFEFNEVGAMRITESCRIVLRMYAEGAPAESEWTAEEIANGGVMARINGCSSDWSEDTLSSENNYPNSMPTVGDFSRDFVFRDNEWIAVDVTDYVKKCAEKGASSASFMVQLTSASSRSYTVSFRSSEYNNAPELLVYPALTNFSPDLDKYANEGYEPWAYAEELVSDWITDGYVKAYGAGDAQLRLDFNEMASITDTGDNPLYTVAASTNAFRLNEVDGETVLSNVSSASYRIEDAALNLTKTGKVSVSADFMFTAFPTGTRTKGDEQVESDVLPLNLLRWMPTSSTNSCCVRIDKNGQLYTGTSTKINRQVSLNEWFNVRLEYDLTAKKYTIYIDGENINQGTLSTSTPTLSRVFMLDGYFTYSANVKNVHACAIGDSYSTFDLTEVSNTAATGAYTIPIQWRASQAKNQINSKIYVRSIDTLAADEGYDKSAVEAPVYDRYGGITNAGFTGNATGYFHTEIHNGRTFIIDPLGNPYFAVGMNTVQLGATDNQKAAAVEQFGSEAGFYEAVTAEFREIGINTVWGGDVEQFLETGNFGTVKNVSLLSGYMSSLKLSNSNSSVKFKHNNTMNVFDPDFLSYCENKAQTAITEEAAKDERILGWTTDNEISAQTTMLYDYLTVDATAPENAFSYAAAWTFLKARTGKANPSVEDITPALSEEFKSFVYDRYYQVATRALASAGVEQMYLGNRIHADNKSSEGYLRAASQYVDILTVNLYGGPEPSIDSMEYMYQYSGKPLIVTEFYAKAQDALDMNGIPLMNQTNAGWVVETQEDRAAHYENYVLLLLESRCCVGWTWYRFRDNDQRVYGDTAGNVYVDHDITAGAISSYVKVGTYTKTTDAEGNVDYEITLDAAFMEVFNNMDLTVKGDPYHSFVSTTITPENAGDKLFVIHKGEYGGDNSNNGSNKGLYDNQMNIYQPLADAYARVDKHILGLVNYFDALHAE